tara:strand:+ start:434 stop:1045 length:612 start_codon:yes stop_codon:yes gene_type:complete
MQLNKRALLTTALTCSALLGSLWIGITLGRSPVLLNTQAQDYTQDSRQRILDKLERSAAQQAQIQPSLLDPFTQMQQRMDQLFGSIGTDPALFNLGGIGLGTGFANTPPALIEVEESKDEYRVVISLTQDSDVELATELDDNTLSISAQVRTEVQNNNGGRQMSSTSMRQLSRAIPFNSPVDATGMQTERSDSAVVIRIPKLS